MDADVEYEHLRGVFNLESTLALGVDHGPGGRLQFIARTTHQNKKPKEIHFCPARDTLKEGLQDLLRLNATNPTFKDVTYDSLLAAYNNKQDAFRQEVAAEAADAQLAGADSSDDDDDDDPTDSPQAKRHRGNPPTTAAAAAGDGGGDGGVAGTADTAGLPRGAQGLPAPRHLLLGQKIWKFMGIVEHSARRASAAEDKREGQTHRGVAHYNRAGGMAGPASGGADEDMERLVGGLLDLRHGMMDEQVARKQQPQEPGGLPVHAAAAAAAAARAGPSGRCCPIQGSPPAGSCSELLRGISRCTIGKEATAQGQPALLRAQPAARDVPIRDLTALNSSQSQDQPQDQAQRQEQEQEQDRSADGAGGGEWQPWQQADACLQDIQATLLELQRQRKETLEQQDLGAFESMLRRAMVRAEARIAEAQQQAVAAALAGPKPPQPVRDLEPQQHLRWACQAVSPVMTAAELEQLEAGAAANGYVVETSQELQELLSGRADRLVERLQRADACEQGVMVTILRSAAGCPVPRNVCLSNFQPLGTGGCSVVHTVDVHDTAVDPTGRPYTCVVKFGLNVELQTTGTCAMSGRLQSSLTEQVIAERVVSSSSSAARAAAPGGAAAAPEAAPAPGALAAFEGSQHTVWGKHAGALYVRVASEAVPAELRDATLRRVQAEAATAQAHLQAMGTPAEAAKAQVAGTQHHTWFLGISLILVERFAGDLYSVLRTERRLDGAELQLLAGHSVKGLTSIHGAGVVHRDMKPENVFIGGVDPADLTSSSLLDTSCFISDFGLSSVDGSRHREISGTPGYWPPEQQAGGDQDTKSDVYSLGASLVTAALGLRKARQLEEPLPSALQPPGLPVPLKRMHNAAFLEDYQDQLLPDTLIDPVNCPGLNQQLAEFFRGTLAYYPHQRWSMQHVRDSGLLTGSLKLLQQLNVPAVRQQLVAASVARSNSANPDWQIQAAP